MKSKILTQSSFIKTILLALALLLVGQASHLPANAAGGEDDGLLVRGFGSGFGPHDSGHVLLELASSYEAIAVQPDGKIIVTGTQEGKNFWLARFDAEGRLDQTFGVNGQISTTFPGRNFVQAHDVIIQPDNKIVAVGKAGGDFAITRYLPNGAPDRSFDGDGQTTLDFDGGDDIAEVVVIQPDGKIVAGGSAYNCSPIFGCQDDKDFALARFNPDGTPDRSFDGDAKHAFDLGSGKESVETLVLEPNGRIVAIGYTTRPLVSSIRIAVARFLPNGQPDSTFGGGDGKVSADFAGGRDQAHGLALQPDGKLLVGGWATRDGRRQFALARFLPNGDPDHSFNGSGQALADFGVSAEAKGMVLEPDGVATLAGCTQAQPNLFALARFLPNGQLDGSLSSDGKATFTSPTALSACAFDLARDPASGDYLLAGYVQRANNNSLFALARVKGRGGTNTPPSAAPNQYTTALNTPLTIAAPGVLGNDSDGEGQPLVAHLVTPTGNGQLSLEAGGGFTYTPNPGFSGADSFTYQAGDGFNLSDPATVTITVGNTSPNPNPNPGGFSVFLPLVIK